MFHITLDWLSLPVIGIIAFGLYISGIGFRGLTKQRPVLFPTRQFTWFLLFILIPGFVILSKPLLSWENYSSISVIAASALLLILVLIIFIVWSQMTGYLIFGVTEETFREALLDALNRLNLPYQETLFKINLVGLDADLRAILRGSIVQMHIKQRKHAHLTKEIAREMKTYYQNTQVTTNDTGFVAYAFFGIIIAIATAFISFFSMPIR
jgi:hypothetical protein